MKPAAAPGFLFVAALALGGCFGSQPVPAEKFYRLSSPGITAGTAAAPAEDHNAMPTIALEPIDARGVYVERALLYRAPAMDAPLQQYPYSSWAEPPDTMLEDLLLKGLRDEFGTAHVLTEDRHRVAAIRVSMRLRALEQIRDGSSAQARFAATYSAVDRNGATLFLFDWDRQAPAAGPSPQEFVSALNGLVAEADRTLVDRLRQAAASLPAHN